MANYSTRADIIVTVNGKQAEKILKSLRRDAQRLTENINKAAVAGDKLSMRKYQRELQATNRAIEQLESKTNTAEKVLRRLDKATPRELNKALKQLQNELNGIQRGSAAWNSQIQKIRAVKTELQKVNATMQTQHTMWGKFTMWMNNVQAAAMAAMAVVTGLVMAGRRAVKAYADMEESLANTQKYTRMSREDVEELNESFKRMNTRIPREELNLLAQEAGRLGYNTVDSVKQYVDAATVIKVALVDLGDGATQTIAKISNIFGLDEKYGVRKSMLKLGSTVNHLSQNCTASKPYLVEFAQRLAGIGSTAKMSVPDILAFGATLDAHGQKVEVASTALQRTIMALFKSPKEMARKVGLHANYFAKVLENNTTKGVTMFLEALQKLGNDKALSVLSPLFQDLGLDGIRVASVLANLSTHLDFLKWQLGEARTAFKEGSSASKEYAIFNNTVQASIDKAKKRIHELAVDLGEKLFPVMVHIYKSSTAFLKALKTMVDFIIDNKTAIANLLIVLGSYYAATLAAKTATLAWTLAMNIQKTAMMAWNVVVALCTKGLKAAKVAFLELNAVAKLNVFGLIAAGIAAVVVGIKAMLPKVDEFAKMCKDLVKTSGEYSDSMLREQHEIEVLIGKLSGASEESKEYKKAKDALISQYGQYLSGLIDEKGRIIDLQKAYDRLTEAIKRTNKERGINEAEEKVNAEYYSKLSEDLNTLQSSLEAFGASTMDASHIVTKVSEAIAAGNPIPDDIKQLINYYSAQSPKTDLNGNAYNAWQSRLSQSSFMTFGLGVPQPAEIVNGIIGRYDTLQSTLQTFDAMRDGVAPMRKWDLGGLKLMVESLDYRLKDENATEFVVLIPNEGYGGTQTTKTVTREEAEQYLEEYRREIMHRGGKDPLATTTPTTTTTTTDDYDPYKYETEAERKARLAKAKRDKIKARKDFKEALDEAKAEWEKGESENTYQYSNGLKNYTDYLKTKHDLLVQYFKDRKKVYYRFHLEDDEDFAELKMKESEMWAKWREENAGLKVEDAKRLQKVEEVQAQMDYYTPGNELYQKEEALQLKLFEIKLHYLYKMRKYYKDNMEEWNKYTIQVEEAQAAERLRRQKMLHAKVAEWRKQYEYLTAGQRMRMELSLLYQAQRAKLISEEEFEKARRQIIKKYQVDELPESARPAKKQGAENGRKQKEDTDWVDSLYTQGVINFEQAEAAKLRILKYYEKQRHEVARKYGSEYANQLLDIVDAWNNLFDKDAEGNWATKLAEISKTAFAPIMAGMQQVNEYYSACADLEVAKAEKKYEREAELAEGNSYKVKKAEKDKEKEIARIKGEVSRKQFAMQVFQAIAQTATNALNAYGAGLEVGGIAGLILAPIAAAMATAAGALQIATIKKQQQAAEVSGYSEGGFTRPGRKDEPAGVVHAGEWVASQQLVNNPRTRPLLEALDYAQKHNVIGSITARDVSRTITAPMLVAASPQPSTAPSVTNNYYTEGERNGELAIVIRRLADRLDEPFVTVNTVTGDHGIKRAQDEYDRLMRNKSPKSRK